MKLKIYGVITMLALLICPKLQYGQAPTLGTAANFVLFSTDGAVSNSGLSHVTGNVGTNNGSNTNFGNVNGNMHSADGATAQCAADLLVAYNQLNIAVPTGSLAPLLGNGDTLIAGIYAIPSATSLAGTLTLNGQGNANAVFIFQIQGPLSTDPGSKVQLINGALACNVFWKIEGLISMAAGCTMRGSLIANNSAIEMNTNDTLEGRALSTAGAVTIDGTLAYTPTGCGSPVLTGPLAPTLASVECYAIFSSDGAVTNSGITTVNGDVGSNTGLTTGYDSLLVTGQIHPIPDISTAACAADLLTVYNYLNMLPADIELLYPALVGSNLVLTPHTYLLNGATTLTDSLYLNAQGNADARFVIQINGAFTTSTYSKVLLLNGAQAKNVYWKVEGAASINDYSVFCGTLICNNGALGVINIGVELNGRALTTAGALTTTAVAATPAIIPGACGLVEIVEPNRNKLAAKFYPNPFSSGTNIQIENNSGVENVEVYIYNALGASVLRAPVGIKNTILPTKGLIPGVYFYKLVSQGQVVQSGKLMATE